MPAYKRTFLVFLLVGLGILGGSIYGFLGNDSELKVECLSEDKSSSVNEITVYVCGAVNKPGVISLAENARIIDAVKICGGTLPIADLTKINMAQPLKDGMQIIVPEKIVNLQNNTQNEIKSIDHKVAKSNSSDKININTADQSELDQLPGIGPAMAQAIIDYRNNEGSFQSLEDLMKVRGIGEAKFNKLKDKATI